MPIKNLSDARRLPRLGKIRLGIKEVSEKAGKEYPVEVDYFVAPQKVQDVYGEKPKELNIMFPVENPEVFFQQYYKRYGYSLLRCKGDGEIAYTWDEEKGGMKSISCPCEKLDSGDCKQIGTLQFLLPNVPGAGVWQITTSSKNSIIDINSSIDFIKSVCGRIRMIPLVLRRVETKTQRLENGKPKSGTHYTLQIDLADISLRQLQEYAKKAPEAVLLPPPDESKDDLLYPENGFKPKEEEEKEKEAVIKESEGDNDIDEKLKEVRKKYSAMLSTYLSAGITNLTKKEEEMVAKVDTPDKKLTLDRHILATEYFQKKLDKLKDKNFSHPEES